MKTPVDPEHEMLQGICLPQASTHAGDRQGGGGQPSRLAMVSRATSTSHMITLRQTRPTTEAR